jgi:hypothetical protein
MRPNEMNAATWRQKRDWTARNIRYHWAENIAPRLIELFTELRLRIDPEDVARALQAILPQKYSLMTG